MNILNKWTAKGRTAALLMLGAVIAFASGCREVDPPAISVDPTMFRVDLNPQELPLRVMSNTDWTADPTPEWITISRTQGRGSYDLTIFVERYDGADVNGRQHTLKFKTKTGEIATSIINQGVSNAKLELKPTQYEIGSDGGPALMTILSNTTWTIEGVVPAPAGWAIPNVTSGSNGKTVTFTVAPNTTGKDREVTFYVVTKPGADQIIEPFTILQFAVPKPTLDLTQTDLFFEAIVTGAGATGSPSIFVPFLTNVSNDPICATGVTWCTATVENQNGVKGIKVTVTNNDMSTQPRECVVTVTAEVDGKSTMEQIKVTQAGSASPEIFILRPAITIPAKGTAPDGSVTFTIGYYTTGTTTVSLVQDFADWIVSATLDATNKKITVVAKENYGDLRSTGITLNATGGGSTIHRTATVTQLAADAIDFTLSSYIKSVPAGGATVEFYAFSNIPNTSVVATGVETWIGTPTITDVTIAGYIGTIKKISVPIDPNTAAGSRVGTIEVFGAYGTQSPVPLTMTINQAGEGSPNAVLARENITVPAPAGGPYTIGIVGVGSIVPVLTSDVAWIPTANLSYANGIISFNTLANTQAESRDGVITISLVSGGEWQFLHIYVKQLGTGSAELKFVDTDWEISPLAQPLDVPVVPVGTTTWQVISWVPSNMFSSNPVDTNPDVLGLAFTANTTTSDRKATIYLLATNGDSVEPYTITVTQKGLAAPKLTLLATEVYLGAAATLAGDEFIIPILGYSPDITFMTPSLSYPSMFNANTKVVTSATDAYLQIGVTANTALDERTGIIRIPAQRGGENQVLEVKVIQAGAAAPVLVFPTGPFSYGPAAVTGENIFFDNPNGATVTVESSPAWFGAAPAVNTDYISFDLDDNASAQSLTGQIVVKAVSGVNSARYTLNVIQSGLGALGASLSDYNLTIAAAGGTGIETIGVLDLPAGATFTATSYDTGWLTIGTSAAGSFTIDATANDTGAPRFGTIAVKVVRGTGVAQESQSLTVYVVQAASTAPAVSVNPTSLSFVATDAAAVGVQTVNLTGTKAGETYNVQSPGWLTVTQVAANAFTAVPAAVNTTGAVKTGDVILTVTGTDGQTQVITVPVSQAVAVAPTVQLNQNTVQFASEDDNTASIDVTISNYNAALNYSVEVSNTKFNASVAAGVITITPVGENISTTALSGVVTVTAQDTATGLYGNNTINVSQLARSAIGVVFPAGPVSISYHAMTAYEVPLYNPNNATITITGISGHIFGTFTGSAVEVNANLSGATRTGSITLQAELNGIIETVTIPYEQLSAAAPTYTVAPGSPLGIAAPAGSTRTIYIGGMPAGAVATVSSINPAGLTSTVAGDTITFTTVNNNTGSGFVINYTVVIRIEYGGVYQYLTVVVGQQQ